MYSISQWHNKLDNLKNNFFLKFYSGRPWLYTQFNEHYQIPSLAPWHEHVTPKHVLIGCQTWDHWSSNIWRSADSNANFHPQNVYHQRFWHASTPVEITSKGIWDVSSGKETRLSWNFSYFLWHKTRALQSWLKVYGVLQPCLKSVVDVLREYILKNSESLAPANTLLLY